MSIKDWLSTYVGSNPVQDADPITSAMPDVNDETALGVGDGDEARSSQIKKLRDKLQAVCKLVGDSINNPVGSLCDILGRDHTNGDATQVRLRERASAPTAVSDKLFLYALDDGGVTKGYVRWSDGTDKELGAGAAAGQTNTVSGSSGITNTGDNVDAVLTPSYGSSANTICQGNDSRLSDARTPTGSAGGDLSGSTYPNPTVASGAISNAKLADMVQATIKGRASGAGTGDPTDLTSAQATAILDAFTDALKGLAPASGGGTTNFLRADGTWAVPSGSGSPLTTKGDVWGFSTVDARIPVGTNGQVLTADSAEALGVKWATPAGGGGFAAYEQEFTAVAGANEFTLSATPAVNANTLSGRNILGVYRDGVRSRYQASVTLANEYNQSGGTNKINVVAQAGGEIITVVYGV